MLLKNLALATIVTAPSPATTGTSLVVTTGEAARFPVPATYGDFYATLFPANEIPHIGNAEIVKVTAVSTDTFTIVRAQRGSTAKSVEAGWKMMQGAYAEDLMSIQTGWIEIQETLSYASPTTITVAAGAPSRYQKGDKLKLTQATDKYFYIVGVADTVLTVTGGSDYTVANAAITSPQLSRIENPFGFPDVFNWNPSHTNISVGSGTVTAVFRISGKFVSVYYQLVFAANTTISFNPYINQPVQNASGKRRFTGTSVYDDAGTNRFFGHCWIETEGRINPTYDGAGGSRVGYSVLDNTTPFTWTTNDILTMNIQYEY